MKFLNVFPNHSFFMINIIIFTVWKSSPKQNKKKNAKKQESWVYNHEK